MIKDIFMIVLLMLSFKKKSNLSFVHGHCGTGKTFLWNTIMNRIRSKELIVLVVASYGILLHCYYLVVEKPPQDLKLHLM
jgi:DNA replication protein DnaC